MMLLLVDASNAFSSIGGNAFLCNVEIKCPSIARYVKHYYSFSNHLFIISGEKRIGVCEAGGSDIEELKISPFPCSPVN